MSDDSLNELGDHIAWSPVRADVITAEVCGGALMLTVQAAAIARVLTLLRDDPRCLFEMLVDLTAVDRPARNRRFAVVYHLLSVRVGQRVRVVLEVDEETPVPTVTGVFSSAGWYEREVWDMFGIVFADHPDLRRLLTEPGFDGHPLRRDFPLSGFVEVRYDGESRAVVHEPITLAQQLRTFEVDSPWAGPAGGGG